MASIFQNVDFKDVLGAAGLGLQAAGSFTQSRATSRTLDANARIAGLNAAEQERLLPLNIEAIRADIASVREAADFRQRELTEERRRAERQRGLSDLSIGAEQRAVATSREEVAARSGITTDILGRTLDAITLAADERVRQLSLQRRDRTAEVRTRAAASGVAVGSGSTEAVTQDISEDIGSQIDVTTAEADIRRAEATLRNTLELSTTRERLAVLDRQITELELEEQQIGFLFEDAVFDTALQEEVNVRNRDIAIERLEREEEIVRRQAEIGIESARQREEFLEDEQDRQLIGDVLSAGSFGVDVLRTFPTLGKKLGNLLGIGGGGGGGGGGAAALTSPSAAALGGEAAIAAAKSGAASLTSSSAAALGGEAAISAAGKAATKSTTTAVTAAKGAASGDSLGVSNLLSPGSFIGDFASGVGATLGGTTLSSGLVSFQSGLGAVGGLQGATTAFASGATLGQALGVVAPPVAAILALPLLAGLRGNPGNTPLARTQATDKVVELLRSGNNLERAKALLGLPNTFEDPSPSTKAKFDFVEGAINRAGGIDALPPASQEVLQAAIRQREAGRAQLGAEAFERLGGNARFDDGATFGDTAAGQLIRQGLTPRQAEERLRGGQ